MKECGDCTACCSGALEGIAYGNEFGKGVKCKFCEGNACSIYQNRPKACSDYYCIYAQDLIPNLQRPDICGILVHPIGTDQKDRKLQIILSPVNYDQTQLHLIQTWAKNNSIDAEILDADISATLSYDENLFESLKFISELNDGKEIVEKVLDNMAKGASNLLDYDFISRCYYTFGFYGKAVLYCEIFLNTIKPQKNRLMHMYRPALKNMAMCCNKNNEPEKALIHIEKNKDLFQEQDDENIKVDILLDEAYSYYLMNEKQKSENILRHAYNNFNLTEEQKLKIEFNLGTHEVRNGNILEGLYYYVDRGEKLNYFGQSSVFANKSHEKIKTEFEINSIHEWDGSTIQNATIYCCVDAGIGDEIINIRFLKEIQNRGMKAIWFSKVDQRSSLYDVFRRHGIEVVDKIIPGVEGSVFYTPAMKLPYKLQSTKLWDEPYLTASQQHSNKWKDKLKNGAPLKIGIRWRGNPQYDSDLHRSLPLQQIYESTKQLIPYATFYSLQLDDYQDDIKSFPTIIDLSTELRTWEDTFAVLSNLDFVITSCTSIAHAAASIGIKTYVMVPITTYYLWETPYDKTPWYGDNVTIFRQQRPRVWDEPMEQLRLEMKKYE